MTEQILTVDLHCHPNMKAFNSGHPKPERNMWENIRHRISSKFAETINERSQQVLKESQSNLYALAEGNVRVFNVSLYPIERGFLHLRNIPKILIGKNRINVLHEVVTGFDASRIMHLKKHYNYFDDLQAEYNFVYDAQGKSPDGKKKFILANNYKDIEAGIKSPGTLIGIISIEGAHVLGTGCPDAEDMAEQDLKELITKNIQAIKKWKVPPFSINLSHHFWNHLCGHATSFKPPINAIINQNKGKNKGITGLGWHAIRELLSRENGKRILIDVKHMSVAGRKEYYNFISNYNSINPNDTIPVIFSHAGVNGYTTMDSSIRENDVAVKNRDHRFHRWSINASNEEIRIIHQSKGLIGLMMDRGVLGGKLAVEKIAAIDDKEKQRREYAKLFWDNAFQVVKAVGDKTGWDVVAFGSDFDGTITHMDPYESAAKLPLLQQDMITYLENTGYQQDLWFGYTPHQLVKKIMGENAMQFYRRFFV
jgi:microsomal dipeptidase-like Zn-dependent dipeptidase